MLFFFSFIVALVTAMILITPLSRFAVRFQVVDLPDARKIHTTAIPRIGGIAIIGGAILPILLWEPFSRDVMAFLLAIGILLIFGIWDDRNNINYRLKLLGQSIAVLVIVLYGNIVIEQMPFIDTDLPDYISIPITIFALVGITNAINLADGLDGLAGGTTLLSLGTIALIAYLAGGDKVIMIALALMGGILGFLRHNTYPARVFMGDTGSQFLGLSVGVLAIILTQKTNPALSPALPILLLGLPILDTLAVMGQRIYERRSPFSPDKNHLHHKLLALGFDHYEAVILIYVVQSALVVSSYLLRYESDALILSLYGLFCLFVLGVFYLAQSHKWYLPARGKKRTSFVSIWVDWLRNVGWLKKGPLLFIQGAIPLFLLLGVFGPNKIPVDMGLMAFVFLVGILMSLFWQHPIASFIEKAGVYITCAMAVYLLQFIPWVTDDSAIYLNGFFIILAVAIALAIRFSQNRRFQVTPLDYLVIFIAVGVPMLPNFPIRGLSLGAIAVKLIILFYASEVALTARVSTWDPLRFGVVLALAIMSIRGLFSYIVIY